MWAYSSGELRPRNTSFALKQNQSKQNKTVFMMLFQHDGDTFTYFKPYSLSFPYNFNLRENVCSLA